MLYFIKKLQYGGRLLYELAEKIIELRLATRRACMCEGKGRSKKNTLSLKTKVLFLIGKKYSPKEIIASLLIAKTNLALLTKDMAQEGLIVKEKSALDKREVCYTLTENGKNYLDERLKAIDENLSQVFPDEANVNEAIALIDKTIALLDGQDPSDRA